MDRCDKCGSVHSGLIVLPDEGCICATCVSLRIGALQAEISSMSASRREAQRLSDLHVSQLQKNCLQMDDSREVAHKRVDELLAELAEATRKGQELCCVHGNLLIEVHDLKAEARKAALEADEHERIQGDWQDAVRGQFIDAGVPDIEIDGSGCDSGDPFDLTMDEICQGVRWFQARVVDQDACIKNLNDRVLEEVADKLKAKDRVGELEATLALARSDIWQTARVNQGNLNGMDPAFPDDAPCKGRIGNHFVHQIGVDQSLRIVSKIDVLLFKENEMNGATPEYRVLTDHKIGGFNDGLHVAVMDAPGEGGACHHYRVSEANPGDKVPMIEQTVEFQKGPIAENGVNGTSNEVLLAIVADRLKGFQSGEFACPENGLALEHITYALDALKQRTQARVKRGVEGTSEK